jgi:radical SAM protein with 4Fe4S-binding SPASM domain
MTQIQTIKLRENKRINLGEQSPIPSPLSLYLEPTSLCNMRCSFCPTGDTALRKLRPNGMMNLKLMNKITQDIKDWGIKIKRINLYKDGEPLLNTYFTDLVKMLRDTNLVDELWVKTNGLLLEPTMNTKLIYSGLDFIGVSVNGTDAESYMRVTRTKVDYERLIVGVTDLYKRKGGNLKLFVKIADSGLTEDEKNKFIFDFCTISDDCSIEQLHGWSASDTKDWKLGTTPTTFEGYPLVEKITCPLPFFMLAINWNGTVSPCNEDWAHNAILGDLNKQTLKEVWQGDTLKQFRIMHLENRRQENKSCNGCDYLRTLPDNLDSYREQVLQRL